MDWSWCSTLAERNRDDFYASSFGAVYSAYMERPKVARVISRLVWGGDIRPYYASMAAIREVPAGGTIVDCPCGAGAAFRTVRPAEGVRYVAVDLSPSMLERARRRTAGDGLNVELIRADATDLPLPSDSADLFLSYWGLHCFEDPRAAIAEAKRVTKSGGRIVGSTFVRGDDSLRQRLLVRPHVGDFGQIATAEEVEAYLGEAGLDVTSLRRSGPKLFFEARA